MAKYTSSRYRCPNCGAWALVVQQRVTRLYEFTFDEEADETGEFDDDLEYGKELKYHADVASEEIVCLGCSQNCGIEDILESRDGEI